MKRFLLRLVLVVVLVLPILGCLPEESKQRVQTLQKAITAARIESGNVDTSIATLQGIITEGKVLLTDPNLSAEDSNRVIAMLDATQAKLVKLRSTKQQIDVAMTIWSQQIEDIAKQESINVGDEVKILGQGISAAGSTVPGPVGAWLKIAGSLLILLGSSVGSAIASKIITQKKADIALTDLENQRRLETTELVMSTQALLDSPLVTNKELAINELRTNQPDESVRQLVRDIKNPLVNTAPES